MTYARRKIGNRVEPAHVSAPPRLRQSDIRRPFNPLPASEPSWLERLFGRA